MNNLQPLRCFAAVVDTGSFTRAAAQLGVTKASVSMQLKQLEAELGVALLVRTTRHVTATDAGRRFYDASLRVLALAEAAVRDAQAEHESLSGVLRVTTTLEYATYRLAPVIAEFSALHTGLHIELAVSARLATLVADRFDVAIRMGTLRDSSTRRAPLGRFRAIAVVSPEYLETRERPQRPEDLERLHWITHIGFDATQMWSPRRQRGKPRAVVIKGRLRADSATVLLSLVRAGRGAAILPDWLVVTDLEAGRLVELLPDWSLPEQGVFAVYPQTEHVPTKVRQFVDFVRDHLAR